MEKAPNAIALASTNDERCLSVTTPLVKYTHCSLAISKSYELIAHDFQRERIAVRLGFSLVNIALSLGPLHSLGIMIFLGR